MFWSDLARWGMALAAAAASAWFARLAGLSAAGAAMAGAAIGTLASFLPVQPRPPRDTPPPAPQPPQPDTAAALGLGAFLDAVSEPAFLIERQIVTRANGAARALLGEHIVGGDVRLAIRHPAATEGLIGRAPGDEPPAPVELIGLGNRDRRWQMVVHHLPQGARMVRLLDRTIAYQVEQVRVDFVANASHELRTPLAAVLGYIETLEEAGGDPATRTRFLKIMFGEAKRMQRLVEDLMSLSRIEADKYSPPRDAIPLPGLVDEVRDVLRGTMNGDADRIVVDVDADTAAVAGDRVQLSQLIHNLVGNALKYGRSGTPIRIGIAPGRSGMMRLVVEDEGDGIAPEHLPRLTERFYRVDPGRSRHLGGTGLGLAIVKHIVERHRGRLDIASEIGRGTRVTVLLPVAG